MKLNQSAAVAEPSKLSTIPTGPSTTLVSTGSRASILSARGKAAVARGILVCLKMGTGNDGKIEWETGVGYSMDFPCFGDDKKSLNGKK